MKSTPAAEAERPADTTNKFYLATWRWHFYAGVYVVPFLIMLALTGLIMLYQDQIAAYQYGDRLFVTPAATQTTASVQLQAVQTAYPEATVSQYILPIAADRSSQFSIATVDGQELTIFVNPYSAQVLGSLDPSTTWYSWANNVHGTFFLGETGDRLIEIAAGFAILLVITGLYLWWPRQRSEIWRAFWPRFRAGKRIVWRDLHSSIGFYASLIIIFFMISGMSWTGVWGDKFVQAWNSFPAEKWEAPLSDKTHESMNHGVLEEVPWNLEQTPLPASGSMAGTPGIPEELPVTLDTVIAYARDNGFTNFRVNLPQGEEGVFTVSADTMSGDITDARQDRTVHLDQYTGKKYGQEVGGCGLAGLLVGCQGHGRRHCAPSRGYGLVESAAEYDLLSGRFAHCREQCRHVVATPPQADVAPGRAAHAQQHAAVERRSLYHAADLASFPLGWPHPAQRTGPGSADSVTHPAL